MFLRTTTGIGLQTGSPTSCCSKSEFSGTCSDYTIYANAKGLDRAGRWRQDNSGQVHPLDSDEEQAVAISDACLPRGGYRATITR